MFGHVAAQSFPFVLGPEFVKHLRAVSNGRHHFPIYGVQQFPRLGYGAFYPFEHVHRLRFVRYGFHDVLSEVVESPERRGKQIPFALLTHPSNAAFHVRSGPQTVHSIRTLYSARERIKRHFGKVSSLSLLYYILFTPQWRNGFRYTDAVLYYPDINFTENRI